MDRREEIFQQLKEILVPYSTDMVVVIDKPDNYLELLNLLICQVSKSCILRLK